MNLTNRIDPEAIADFEERIDNLTRQILKPKPKIVGSDWANRHFYLSPESATVAGKFDWRQAPYQKRAIDLMTDDHTQKVVLQWAARCGKSTAIKAAAAFFAAEQPSNLVWMHATDEVARRFSVTEVDPMFRDIAPLRGMLGDKLKKDSGNTALTKVIPGAVWYLVGAATDTRSHGLQARVAIADEVDRYPLSAGIAGDVIGLLKKRTSTVGHRSKLIVASTPTITGLSVINREYLGGTQEQFYIKCPYKNCGHEQTLIWTQLSYSEDPKNPVYICAGCAAEIPESYKLRLMLEAVDRDDAWRPANPDAEYPSLQLNALFSTAISWADLVSDWLAIKKNRFLRQVFINASLAETWDEAGENVNPHALAKRLEEYNAPFPTQTETKAGAAIVGCGVDVHPNRLELLTVALGGSSRYFVLDSMVIDGDTGTERPWNELTTYIQKTRFRTLHGGQIGIRAVAIDSSYNAGTVYAYVEKIRNLMPKRSVIAVKGSDTYSRIIADRARQSKKYNALWFQIGENVVKEFAISLLKNEPSESGHCLHLPLYFSTEGERRYMDEEVLAQLTSERPTVKYVGGKPRKHWEKIRDRNEAWDCLCYAIGAIHHLGLKVRSGLDEMAQKIAEKKGSIPVDDTADDTVTPIQQAPQAKQRKRKFRIHTPKHTSNASIWGRRLS